MRTGYSWLATKMTHVSRCACPSACTRPRQRSYCVHLFFFFQAEDGIRDVAVTGVQTCALPISGQRKIPVLFVSGRISDRSFARYRKSFKAFGFFLRPFLKDVLSQARAFLMQTEKDAERIRALGAPAERVAASGNLKYDSELPLPTPLSDWLEGEVKRSGRSPVIVAGSVVASEEPLALIAFGTLQGEYRDAFLVLAPRKPEQFAAAAEYIDESHRKFVRRSALPIPGPAQVDAQSNSPARDPAIPDNATVLLLDSIG